MRQLVRENGCLTGERMVFLTTFAGIPFRSFAWDEGNPLFFVIGGLG